MVDLRIVNACLPEQEGLWEIAITDGIITEIDRAVQGNTILDAQKQLVIPGLVDAHIHLDKVFLLDRTPAVEGTFHEAMRETLKAKQAFTVADIQARARRALWQAISWGITLMRSHVEVDQVIGLTGMEALLPLRQEFAWGITLQLAVFAQEGITNQPHLPKLLREAVALGADVIGSAPYIDPDPEQNVRIVFDIAQEFDCDVDFHLDFLDDDLPLMLPFVIAETQRRGWQGRVCLGHMTKLANLPPEELLELARSMRLAGISLLALPASDLYMMARKDTHRVRRGVAPIHTLATSGVTVGVATNNVQNLFTPFGDGDVLKICTLLAQVLHLGTASQQAQCLAMATTEAAAAIGELNHSITPGHLADLVILNAHSVTEAIAAAPLERTVIKRGRIVAQRKCESQFWTSKSV
ncbi:amidohydrolase family protein [Leptolyngbya boryana CZ1]|uniref:Amidohydrolase family protein n=1 Tax=Leptolyngbya boryana CZ1 TaxID=3060204 RepID=A0AA96WT31_LEPBY|nr:amidohydrolase family protein [Leptolyngbya boryana]WNZ45147.1 amidohydrolase family protein [Leptolyngbya boryana CZ1]